MTLRVVRLGSPRASGEGVRIGTVRRPPRGVPKARFAADDWYDVWYPNLSPSPELMNAFTATADALFARLTANEQQAQTLSTLRNTLLPRLISGQLRLPEAQAAVEAAL